MEHIGAATAGEYLSVFKIDLTSSSLMLYENGRQQVELTLSVAQSTNHTLTDAEVDTLSVVYRTADGTYTPLPAQPTGSARWFVSSLRDERFEYFPFGRDSQPLQPTETNAKSVPSAVVKSRLYYVSTTAPGGSTIELFARISIEGETFVTEGTFASAARLTAVKLPEYSSPDYQWKITWREGEPPSTAFINEWSLTALRARFSFGALRGDAFGMIRWQRPAAGETAASNVGIALPNDSQFKYSPNITLGNSFLGEIHKEVMSSHNNQIVVVLQASNHIPFHSSSVAYGGPFFIEAYDIDGNFHEVEIAFDDEQSSDYDRRTHLAATVTSPAKTKMCLTTRAWGTRHEEQ